MIRCTPFILLLFACLEVGAQSSTACSILEDPDERLACYDRLFQQRDQLPEQSSTRTTTIEDLALPSKEAPTPASSEPLEPTVDDEFGREQTLRKKPTDPKKVVEIESIIKALRRKDRQEIVFLLENGQIWIQDVFRFMTVDQGDAVSIRRLRMGGYLMTTEGGASTRVKRIK